jgi:hypothetical protein
MNILKLFYLNSTTLNKIEIFDGKDWFLWFLLYMWNFMESLLLNVVLLSLFVGIAKLFPNQNNSLLDYYIIHMCIDFIA